MMTPPPAKAGLREGTGQYRVKAPALGKWHLVGLDGPDTRTRERRLYSARVSR